MLGLIIYIIAALCFIAAVVLLSLIGDRAVKIIVLIIFLLIFVGGMTFLLYKISGQQDFSKIFDTLSGTPVSVTGPDTVQSGQSGISQGQSGNGFWGSGGGNNTGGTAQSGAVTGSEGSQFVPRDEAENTLGAFLSAWQQYDADTMQGLAGGSALQKLGNELPFETSSPIQGFQVTGTQAIDPEEKTAQVVMAFLNDGGCPVDAGYIIDISSFDGEWKITNVACAEPGPIFDIFDTYTGDSTATETQAASAADEEAVQTVVHDHILALQNMEYDLAYTYLTGRAADEYYPEVDFGPYFDYQYWDMISYEVSGTEATVNVHQSVFYTDGSSDEWDEVYYLQKIDGTWHIEYIEYK